LKKEGWKEDYIKTYLCCVKPYLKKPQKIFEKQIKPAFNKLYNQFISTILREVEC